MKGRKSKQEYSLGGKKTLEVLEGANDYNTWIGESLSKFLSPPLLEVGAGTGNITKFFKHHKPFFVSEIDTDFLIHLKKKFAKIPKIKVIRLNIEQKPVKAFLKKFSSIVAVNVLEHIKDDTKALKNLQLMLKKNGRLVLLVPAKKNAYTRLDKSLGHFRRYEMQELKKKLTSAGFTLEKIYFFNIVGLFTWIIRDKVSRTHTHLSPTHVSLFDKIIKVLKIIEKYIKVPVGISLIVVAKNESKK